MSYKPVLHLIFDDKFIDRAISQFEKALPDKNIYLLDIPSKNYTIKYIKKNIDKVDVGIRGANDYFEKIKSYQFDVVVIHSLSYYFSHLVNTILENKKIIWIFWGGEVYDFLKEFRNNNFKAQTKPFINRYLWKVNLRTLLRPIFFRLKNPRRSWNFSKYQAFKKIDGFALAHKNEFDDLKNELNLSCKLHWFTYYSIESLITDQYKNSKIFGNNILVGNSATPSNNHLDVLHQIKNEISIGDRQIIVPLSYGEKWYRNKIIDVGTDLFSNNFKALVDFIPLVDYNQIVFSCNVVIMNHLRQQAVGNLIVSIWMGAKVFLDERNPLFKYFHNLGLIIFSVQKDLKLIELDNNLSEDEIKSQRFILNNHYCEDNVIYKTRAMVNFYL